jgi:hypothetical protein
LLTQEGIRGNEEFPDATHNTMLPFTRMIAGAADYTVCYFDPRIKNTHAHQLALPVIFYSPLQTLYWYDTPARIEDTSELEFFDKVPVTWDETKVIHDRIGEYVTIARRSGSDWFVGTIGNNDARQLTTPLDFLDSGHNYTAHIYATDDKMPTATKVKITRAIVDSKTLLQFQLKERDGCAIHIVPATKEDVKRLPLPQNLPQAHPRLLTTPEYKPVLQKQIKNEAWAKDVMQGILNRIYPYVEKTQTQSDWMLSRLMMYWKSKATNVYIRGGVYSHADGEAPVPTVRFGSTRGQASVYSRPNIEAIIPYMDDTKGVYFHNAKKEGQPLEWSEQANASGIESINEQIMGLGKDAAFVYWLTGDEKYAKFAFDLFDTYMTGMYYRNEPIDLNKGHAQTLVGLSTFEVIQERILNELSYLYDFLYAYIKEKPGNKIDLYAATFKKWIDITIKNGVPQNNWNLHQAKFILKVAMVLEDNRYYADGKGREYYINYILNRSSARQWSLTKLMEYGYDFNTGVWAECPGYAQGVTRDFTNFIRDYDNTFNQNLLPYLPIMTKAVEMLPQYLFPNNMITAFGDTHYGGIYTEAISDMMRMAQKYNDQEMEIRFTKMYKLFNVETLHATSLQQSPQIYSFFTAKPLVLNKKIEKGKDFVLFMGNGTSVTAKGFTIRSEEKTTAVLTYKNGEYFFTCDAPVTITTVKNKKIKLNKTTYQIISHETV